MAAPAPAAEDTRGSTKGPPVCTPGTPSYKRPREALTEDSFRGRPDGEDEDKRKARRPEEDAEDSIVVFLKGLDLVAVGNGRQAKKSG
jgi:hypothetical protein